LSKPTNPPAFAGSNVTLRDYFAGLALQGFVARGVPTPSKLVRFNDVYCGVAAECYEIADAMLAMRED